MAAHQTLAAAMRYLWDVLNDHTALDIITAFQRDWGHNFLAILKAFLLFWQFITDWLLFLDYCSVYDLASSVFKISDRPLRFSRKDNQIQHFFGSVNDHKSFTRFPTVVHLAWHFPANIIYKLIKLLHICKHMFVYADLSRVERLTSASCPMLTTLHFMPIQSPSYFTIGVRYCNWNPVFHLLQSNTRQPMRQHRQPSRMQSSEGYVHFALSSMGGAGSEACL